jgi:hypothetical protein
MKSSRTTLTAFSLVEVTLALGVAGFCLIAVFGLMPVGLKSQQASVQQTTANAIISAVVADLRAAVHLPPGLSKQFGLHPHNGGPWDPIPDTLFFTNEGNSVGPAGTAITPDSVYRVTISYIFPPTATTSLADIKVTCPAQVDPVTGVPAGSVETFIAINR